MIEFDASIHKMGKPCGKYRHRYKPEGCPDTGENMRYVHGGTCVLCATAKEKKPTGRPRVMDNSKLLSVRIDEADMKAIDAYIEKMQADMPGFSFNRADVIRSFIKKCLSIMQKDNRQEPPNI